MPSSPTNHVDEKPLPVPPSKTSFFSSQTRRVLQQKPTNVLATLRHFVFPSAPKDPSLVSSTVKAKGKENGKHKTDASKKTLRTSKSFHARGVSDNKDDSLGDLSFYVFGTSSSTDSSNFLSHPALESTLDAKSHDPLVYNPRDFASRRVQNSNSTGFPGSTSKSTSNTPKVRQRSKSTHNLRRTTHSLPQRRPQDSFFLRERFLEMSLSKPNLVHNRTDSNPLVHLFDEPNSPLPPLKFMTTHPRSETSTSSVDAASVSSSEPASPSNRLIFHNFMDASATSGWSEPPTPMLQDFPDNTVKNLSKSELTKMKVNSRDDDNNEPQEDNDDDDEETRKYWWAM